MVFHAGQINFIWCLSYKYTLEINDVLPFKIIFKDGTQSSIFYVLLLWILPSAFLLSILNIIGNFGLFINTKAAA